MPFPRKRRDVENVPRRRVAPAPPSPATELPRWKGHVIAANYPRSGYHLVVDVLNRCVPGFSRSDNYERCYIDGAEAIWLNHDFWLTIEPDAAQAYLVQYRHPLFSIASWIEYDESIGNDAVAPGDIPSAFGQYLLGKLKFWKSHVRKWGLTVDVPRKCVVLYEDLVERPSVELSRVIDLMGIAVEREALDCAIKEVGVRPRRTMSSTTYVQKQHIDLCHEIVGEEMAALGITDERSGVCSRRT